MQTGLKVGIFPTVQVIILSNTCAMCNTFVSMEVHWSANVVKKQGKINVSLFDNAKTKAGIFSVQGVCRLLVMPLYVSKRCNRYHVT